MAPGTVVGGKYLLSRLLGQGAMGEVWAATNTSTGGEVALKLLSRPRDELRHRLLREARACGKLRHRNVIDIYDVGETVDGEPFLVMALLSGETLAELLDRQRRLDPKHAAQIARDVARALSAAHKAGVIHRDLKPANIFLHREEGADDVVVKVLDFGVSKDVERCDGLVTIAGATVGSPAYMSPEQARIAPDLDHRTDIWSLGVVLFEMLTGKRPFEGDAHQVLAKIALGPIPLIEHYVRNADPALVALVARCLEREPDQRFSSAEDLAAALHPFTVASVPAPASLPNGASREAPSSLPGQPVSIRHRSPDSDNDAPTLRWNRETLRAMIGPGGVPEPLEAPPSGPPAFVRTMQLGGPPSAPVPAPRFGPPPPIPGAASIPPLSHGSSVPPPSAAIPSLPQPAALPSTFANASPLADRASDKRAGETMNRAPAGDSSRPPARSSVLSSMAPLVHPSRMPTPVAARGGGAEPSLFRRPVHIAALVALLCSVLALAFAVVIRARRPVPAGRPVETAPSHEISAPPAPESPVVAPPPTTTPPVESSTPAIDVPSAKPPATTTLPPPPKASSSYPRVLTPPRKLEAPHPPASAKASTLESIQQSLGPRGK
ncbi:serine/threonine protein kinase [Minicystis rosea]|nr:serine/threonine protein kinase [Minicystis rosea]